MTAGTLVHPDHRQGDVELNDGGRLFTCTKTLRSGARTTMLLIPFLFRLDVRSRDDSFDIKVRRLSRSRLESTLGRTSERAAQSYDGALMKITEFEVTAPELDVRPIAISICLPAVERLYEFRCTAVAVVPARPA